MRLMRVALIGALLLRLDVTFAGAHQKVTTTMNDDEEKSNSMLRGRRVQQGQGGQWVQREPCVLVLKTVEYEDRAVGDDESWECEMQGSDASAGNFMKISGLNRNEEWKKTLVSGRSTFFAPGAVISGDQLEVPATSKYVVAPRKEWPNRNNNSNGRKLASVGDRSVLVVRVKAPDATTTSSMAEISNAVFGTSGDPVNLVSQYRACSYDKLRFAPTTESGTTNGVYEVSITQTVAGVDNTVVREAALTVLTEKFGDWTSKFDHVMLCLPPGTSGSWIAYAYVNSYLTVYNNEWCNSVSGQMHEIGHNLGLGHSGEGSETYADQTGIMGYSYLNSDGPIMCFNGAKNWQLGWYSDRHSVATPLISAWQGQLVGLSDYATSTPAQSVVLQIQTTSLDYYVAYNRNTGINSETQEGGSQVMITTRTVGTDFAPSLLVAKLNAGQEHVITNFNGSGISATIKVNSIVGGIADVTVSMLPAPAPTFPTPSPTAAPTKAPTTPRPTTPRPTKATNNNGRPKF